MFHARRFSLLAPIFGLPALISISIVVFSQQAAVAQARRRTLDFLQSRKKASGKTELLGKEDRQWTDVTR
jgi:hypothetical protein